MNPDYTKYSRSKLTNEQMNQYCNKILFHLDNSEDFRNPNLRVWDIYSATGISPAIISQSLNRFLNKSFFDVVNHRRIEEVKKTLLSDKNNSYSIDGIANDCGFRCRSTFYVAFKKLEGISPTKWLKTMMKNNKNPKK